MSRAFINDQGMGNTQILDNGQIQMSSNVHDQQYMIMKNQKAQMYNTHFQRRIAQLQALHGKNVAQDMKENLMNQLRAQVQQWRQNMIDRESQQTIKT